MVSQVIDFIRGKMMKGNKRDLILRNKELELELEFNTRTKKLDVERVRLEEQEKAQGRIIEVAVLNAEKKALKNPYEELKEILTILATKFGTIEIKQLSIEKRKD